MGCVKLGWWGWVQLLGFIEQWNEMNVFQSVRPLAALRLYFLLSLRHFTSLHFTSFNSLHFTTYQRLNWIVSVSSPFHSLKLIKLLACLVLGNRMLTQHTTLTTTHMERAERSTKSLDSPKRTTTYATCVVVLFSSTATNKTKTKHESSFCCKEEPRSRTELKWTDRRHCERQNTTPLHSFNQSNETLDKRQQSQSTEIIT